MPRRRQAPAFWRKSCAGLLVVLVLLPFTAPWSVCGLSDIREALDGCSLREPVQIAEIAAAVASPGRDASLPVDPATSVLGPVEGLHRVAHRTSAPPASSALTPRGRALRAAAGHLHPFCVRQLPIPDPLSSTRNTTALRI
jgi:hypothetical protein